MDKKILNSSEYSKTNTLNFYFARLSVIAIFMASALSYYKIVPVLYYSDFEDVQLYIDNVAHTPVFEVNNFGINLLEPLWHNVLFIAHEFNIKIETLHIFILTLFVVLYSKIYADRERYLYFLIAFAALPSFSSLLIGNTKGILSICIILLGLPKFFNASQHYNSARLFVVVVIAAMCHFGVAISLLGIRMAIHKSAYRQKLIVLAVSMILIYYLAFNKLEVMINYYLISGSITSYDAVRYLVGWSMFAHFYLVYVLKRRVIPIFSVLILIIAIALGLNIAMRLMDILVLFYLHSFMNSCSIKNLSIYMSFNFLLYIVYLGRFIL